MNQLKLRVAVPDDEKQIVEWLNQNPQNLFDPDVLKYPTLRVLCAYGDEPVAFLPTQQALFLESLGINPKSSEDDRAQALRDLVKGAELVASASGIKEIYLFGRDERVLAIAEKRGFERIPWPLLRMKL
jgi:hypothetical protein